MFYLPEQKKNAIGHRVAVLEYRNIFRNNLTIARMVIILVAQELEIIRQK